MTCEKHEAPAVNGGSARGPVKGPQPLSLEHDGGARNVGELLHKGIVPCGALFLTVNLRLVECGRPEHHPYPHRPFASAQDVLAAPYPDPLPDRDRAEYDGEAADRAHDEAVWSR